MSSCTNRRIQYAVTSWFAPHSGGRSRSTLQPSTLDQASLEESSPLTLLLFPLTLFFQHLLQNPPHRLGHLALPLCGWMYPVGLIEGGYPSDAFEQKRDQLGAAGPGQLGIHRLELLAIGPAVIGRNPHPDYDHFRSGLDPLGAAQDGLDVGSQRVRRQPPKPVVRAGLDHQHGYRLSQQPVDALPCSGRRLPTYPSI